MSLQRLSHLYVQYVRARPCQFLSKHTEVMKTVVLPLLVRLGQRKTTADLRVLEHIHWTWQAAVGDHDCNGGDGSIKDSLEALQMILDAYERQTSTLLPVVKLNVKLRPNALAKEARTLMDNASARGLLDVDEQAQTAVVERELLELPPLKGH